MNEELEPAVQLVVVVHSTLLGSSDERLLALGITSVRLVLKEGKIKKIRLYIKEYP